MADAFESLHESIGRSSTQHDVITASQTGRLAAALGVPNLAQNIGDEVPGGWQIAFFPVLTPLAELREDGQPAGGSIMPKVPLPSRRLSRVSSRFLAPLRIGDSATKTSEISEVSIDGEGPDRIVRVQVRETIETAAGTAIVSERDFEFFTPGGKGAKRDVPPVPATPQWRRSIRPTPVMMFRMSAASFNSHRVHYDRDYTTKKEGHPGLVVPVTLASSLMLELCRQQMAGKRLESFWFSSVKRLYDEGDFEIVGQPQGKIARFWTINSKRDIAVLAEASFSD